MSDPHDRHGLYVLHDECSLLGHRVDQIARSSQRLESVEEISVCRRLVGERTYIKTSGSNIRADEGTLLSITEFKEGVCSLLLFLLAVKIENRKINVIK